MAARPWRIIALALSLALTVWIWGLAGALLAIRWSSVERPGPPVKEIFPYGEMRIGIDASYPPFAVDTGNGMYGLEIDIGEALAERIGIPVRFVNLGYDGLYDALRVDQVDLLISALPIDPARRNDVFYTLPYFNAGLVLVSTDGVDNMQAMSGKSLAYEFGSTADAEARQWLRRILPFTTRPYERADIALDAVRLGEADAALVDSVSARLYMAQHEDWQAEYHHITDLGYVMALRLDRGTTWTSVNETLQDLLNDGTIAAIIDRWLG